MYKGMHIIPCVLKKTLGPSTQLTCPARACNMFAKTVLLDAKMVKMHLCKNIIFPRVMSELQ